MSAFTLLENGAAVGAAFPDGFVPDEVETTVADEVEEMMRNLRDQIDGDANRFQALLLVAARHLQFLSEEPDGLSGLAEDLGL